MSPPWSYLGSCWGYVGAILGPLGASPAAYSSNIKNTYFIEIIQSLSLSPCRARMQLQKTTMSSDIEFTHFIELHQSLSLCPCRANTYQPNTQHPTMSITHRNMHAFPTCPNCFRLTPVQRKRSLEKLRCYQTLKSHTLWKC